MNTISIVKQSIRENVLTILLAVALTLLVTGAGLVSPLLFQQLIDVAIPRGDVALVAWLLLGTLLVPVVETLVHAASTYVRAYLGEAVSQALREKLFGHVIHAAMADVERTTSGEIVFRITRECGRIGELFVAERLLPFCHNVILLAGTLAIVFVMNWRLGLLSLAPFLPATLLTRALAGRSRELDRRFYDVLVRGETFLHEVFGGIRTVRALGGEEREKRAWADWIVQHWRGKARMMMVHELAIRGATDLIVKVLWALMLGVAAYGIIGGRASLGELVAFLAYVPRAYAAFKAVLDFQIDRENLLSSAERIDELFALADEREGFGELALPAPPSGARIAFEEVSFRYGQGGFSLRSISFAAEPGEFLGIVGPTGGGKSTIIDLLLGFYHPESGRIAVDGHSLAGLSLDSLRRQIGLVSQDVFLLDTTIAENVAYPDRDAAGVEEAARAAQLDEFVRSLPEGYATAVGERGALLSGGERQRIAIARALLRQPRIVLFDEATAALDALTEARLRRALRRVRQGRTLVAVAHRLTTVMDADRVLVIDGGEVVQAGAPGVLAAEPGLFAELCAAQSVTFG